MAIESRQIYATVEIETIETIVEMAAQEKRSFSNMISILLEEAIENRKTIEKIKSKKTA